jgi:hypothetical protein
MISQIFIQYLLPRPITQIHPQKQAKPSTLPKLHELLFHEQIDIHATNSTSNNRTKKVSFNEPTYYMPTSEPTQIKYIIINDITGDYDGNELYIPIHNLWWSDEDYFNFKAELVLEFKELIRQQKIRNVNFRELTYRQIMSILWQKEEEEEQLQADLRLSKSKPGLRINTYYLTPSMHYVETRERSVSI